MLSSNPVVLQRGQCGSVCNVQYWCVCIVAEWEPLCVFVFRGSRGSDMSFRRGAGQGKVAPALARLGERT